MFFLNSIRTILKHWCNNGDPLGGSTITSQTFFNSKSMELNFPNKTLYFINNLSINTEQSLFTKKKTLHKSKSSQDRMQIAKTQDEGLPLQLLNCTLDALFCFYFKRNKQTNKKLYTHLVKRSVSDAADHCLRKSQCSRYNRFLLSQYCSSSSALAVVKQWRLYSSKSWFWKCADQECWHGFRSSKAQKVYNSISAYELCVHQAKCHTLKSK